MFLERILLLEVLDAERVSVVTPFLVTGSAYYVEFGCFCREHHAGEEGNGFGQTRWKDYGVFVHGRVLVVHTGGAPLRPLEFFAYIFCCY